MYPKTLYLAGPYTAKNADGTMDILAVRQNIAIAKYWGASVARLGAMPFIPHTNTDETFLDVQSPTFWYAGTLRLLEAADGILMLPRWRESKGAREELERATILGKHIFYTDSTHSLDDLLVWLEPLT